MTNGYNKLLLPVNDHRTQVNVSIQSFLVSINSFDEINGKIALTWLFTLEWIEERMSWNPDVFDNITSFALSARDIWHPRLLLQQSAGSIQELGSIENPLRIFNNGIVRWATGNVFEIVCSVDVTFFPFDKQTCRISFIDPSYGLSELAIVHLGNSVNMSNFAKNSQWTYIAGNVLSGSNIANVPYLEIQLHLARRSEFYIVYIIIPVTLLGAINNFVFLLPASSGERSSVAITVFLSFVVYLEIVNRNIPQSSDPMAFIYYYLMFLMMYSSTVFFFCIMALRIHDRKGNIPSCIQKFVLYTRTRPCCKRRPNSVSDDAEVKIHHTLEDNNKPEQNDKSNQSYSDTVCESCVAPSEITWTDVGSLFDEITAKILNAIFWTFSIITIAQLYNNTYFIDLP
ncbi:hypothetical protein DPMN_071213 [Dreissena polymorpha]|uniref:Uncharacterized protein n=1 Tax=Dreissena polymorpha TaxID=45954 RepID=A0A9D4BW28_DREPO|nr:hypothetical protein DPMN_071213 [Dreissena polymorpha]